MYGPLWPWAYVFVHREQITLKHVVAEPNQIIMTVSFNPKIHHSFSIKKGTHYCQSCKGDEGIAVPRRTLHLFHTHSLEPCHGTAKTFFQDSFLIWILMEYSAVEKLFSCVLYSCHHHHRQYTLQVFPLFTSTFDCSLTYTVLVSSGTKKWFGTY